MNKRNIFTFLLAIIAMVGQAQEISKAEPTANDYIKLLNKQGYHVIALDLSKLEKDKYLMSPVIQIWSKGEMQQNLMEDWSVAYTNEAPKMTVNLMPKNDTLFVCNFQFDDVCGFSMDLPMPAVKNEADGSENSRDLSNHPFPGGPGLHLSGDGISDPLVRGSDGLGLGRDDL